VTLTAAAKGTFPKLTVFDPSRTIEDDRKAKIAGPSMGSELAGAVSGPSVDAHRGETATNEDHE
jgi:hypothetical protein